jgi:hypothetical protein
MADGLECEKVESLDTKWGSARAVKKDVGWAAMKAITKVFPWVETLAL